MKPLSWRVTAFWFLLAAILLTLAGCATPEQTTAAIAASIGAAGEFVAALKPVLSPEMQAKVETLATTIDGKTSAVANAVGVLADAIAAMKASVTANVDAVSKGLVDASQQIAALPSREEVYFVGTGSASLGMGASRVLSHYKHAKPA